MNHVDKSEIVDRFLGAALGTFAGDALGEPVEGWSHTSIANRFGILDRMIRDQGRYTDDTQMMIGVLETLAEQGQFDPEVCARRFAENFDPARGYGRRIFGVVDRIRQGIPWDKVGTDSFGNGAAMRIAPIGCFYHNDLQALKKNAVLSASITHNHPEGLAGAVAQAAAVGLAFQCGIANEPVEPILFINTILALVNDVDKKFCDSLDEIKSIISRSGQCDCQSSSSMAEPVQTMTEQYNMSLRAIESVPPAIGAFLLTNSFRDAVILAVNLGGDTDTIGAMAGAVAGAYYGYARIPEEWLACLENKEKGRDYVIDLVERVVSFM